MMIREISYYLSSSSSQKEGLDRTGKTVEELDAFFAKIRNTCREARYAAVAKSLKEHKDEIKDKKTATAARNKQQKRKEIKYQKESRSENTLVRMVST